MCNHCHVDGQALSLLTIWLMLVMLRDTELLLAVISGNDRAEVDKIDALLGTNSLTGDCACQYEQTRPDTPLDRSGFSLLTSDKSAAFPT